MGHAIHRVEQFEIVGAYSLALRFEDGSEQRIDFRPVLEGEINSRNDRDDDKMAKWRTASNGIRRRQLRTSRITVSPSMRPPASSVTSWP